MEQIPLSKPSVGAREKELVAEALESGNLALGEFGERLEQELADYLGAAYAVAVSSGTAALHLGVRALGVGSGDEVITTPFSFISSANCVIYEGATPVFVDIDPVTLNMDLGGVEAAVSDRTKALLPVHIFGYPVEMERIESTAKRHGLEILEDACEALGAVHGDGVKVGARGNLACFGFYPNKQLTTGEGGVITCPDTKTRDRLTSERNQGRVSGTEHVEHDRLGYNYRLGELSAALGVAQLERLEKMLKRRSRVAGWYGEQLSEIDGLQLPCPDRDGAERSWFVYVVQLPDGSDRARVIARLAADGIASKPYLPAIHLQPYFRERFGFRRGEFPVCEKVAERTLALPFFTDIKESQVDRVSERVKSALNGS